MKIKRQIFICILTLLPFLGISQVSVTSYSIYALGATLPINEKFSGDFRIYTNQQDIENTDIQLTGFYHFKPRDFHQFSVGVGLGLDPSYGENAKISMPVMLQIYPLQSFKPLSLVFELATGYLFEQGVKLQHLWGIRYTFAKKNKQLDGIQNRKWFKCR